MKEQGMRLNRLVIVTLILQAGSVNAEYPRCMFQLCFGNKFITLNEVVDALETPGIYSGCEFIKIGNKNKKLFAHLKFNTVATENTTKFKYLETLTVFESSPNKVIHYCNSSKMLATANSDIQIQSSEEDLIRMYGKPSQVEEIKLQMEFSAIGDKKLKIQADKRYVYIANPEKELLATYFYIKNKKINGIEISVAE